jgi:hypothetical protein
VQLARQRFRVRCGQDSDILRNVPFISLTLVINNTFTTIQLPGVGYESKETRQGGMMLTRSCSGSIFTDDDDVFYLFLQKQNLGAKLHIYL